MKRKLASLLIVATMLFTLAGCGGGTAANESAATENSAASESEAAASADATFFSVVVPTAPPALPVFHMIEDNLLGEDVTIELATWNAPEELLAMVQGGEHDLYAFPLTVVSTLYNKGMDVRLMNVNTWGVTYFMTTDPDFTSWSDLAGKTVITQTDSAAQDVLEGDQKDLAATFATLDTIGEYNTAFMQLESGAVDAVACDLSIAQYQLAAKPDAYTQLDKPLSSEHYAVGFKKGDTKSADAVTESLKALYEDGTVKDLCDKYTSYGLSFDNWVLK